MLVVKIYTTEGVTFGKVLDASDRCKQDYYYSAIHRMIIVLKDRATHRVAKRIGPSLSLLKGPSLKIRKRTTFT